MRRGGRLFLLLGLLIAALVAVGAIFVLGGGAGTSPTEVAAVPTSVPTRQIVVARVDIQSNTLLTDTETFLTFDEIPETEFSEDYFVSTSELQGKLTVQPILATEPIRRSSVADAGLSVQVPAAQNGQPRTKVITVQVNNLTGVGDEIVPGDFVDVLSSFSIQRVYLRPGFTPEGNITFVEESFTGQSTKTLLQNVQVLKIKRPPPPAEGTATPAADGGEAPPAPEEGQTTDGTDTTQTTAADTIQPGSWLLFLAVTDQQAEVLKFSREQGTGITLVLRGRGDTAVETTLGATLDLLVTQFGLPVPNPAAPAVQNNTSLTPQPTTAPAQPTVTPNP